MSPESNFEMLLMAIWNGWWQGIVLTAVVWLVMRDMPRIGAATRLAIWQLTLLAVVALPVLQRVPSWVMPPANETQAVAAPARAESPGVPPIAKTEAVPLAALPPKPLVEIRDREPAEVFLVIALLLAGIQLLRIAIGYLWLRRLKKKSFPSGFGLPGFVTRVAQVRVSDKAGMPISIGFLHPMILLPRQMASQLSAADLEHIILHEAGHLERRDDWFGLWERFLRAIFFFQPAVYFIGREIDREREMACDDWVLQRSGEARDYARALSRVAEMASVERAPLLATGAGRRKEIFERMEAIFDQARNRAPRISAPILGAAACGLAVLVSQSAPLNHLLGIRHYDHRMVNSSDNHRLEIGSRGDIHFAKGNRDIDRMQPGGRFYLELQADGRTQRVEMEADAQGQIHRSYYADGMQQRFTTEAQRLLAKEVTPWAMSRGEDINDTLNWLLEERGFDGTLREIRAVPSDEAQRRFLSELLARSAADEFAVRRIWRAAQGMGNDHEKKMFFLEGTRVTPKVDTLPLVESIGNDEVKAELLQEFVQQGSVARALTVARSLHSEERKEEVLKRAWENVETSPAQLPQLVEPVSRLLESIHNEEAHGNFVRFVVAGKTPLAGVQDLLLQRIDAFHSQERMANAMLSILSRPDLSSGMVDEISRRALRLHSADARREIQEAIQKYGVGRRG
jgi:beta-lactamase regulating signal transducer with metallopeptidase domain